MTRFTSTRFTSTRFTSLIGALLAAIATPAAALNGIERMIEAAEPCSELQTDVNLQFVRFDINIDRFKEAELRDFRIMADPEHASVRIVVRIACETRPSSRVPAEVSAVFDIRADAPFDDCAATRVDVDVSDLDVDIGGSVSVATDKLAFFEAEAERRLVRAIEPRVVEFCAELAE